MYSILIQRWNQLVASLLVSVRNQNRTLTTENQFVLGLELIGREKAESYLLGENFKLKNFLTIDYEFNTLIDKSIKDITNTN